MKSILIFALLAFTAVNCFIPLEDIQPNSEISVKCLMDLKKAVPDVSSLIEEISESSWIEAILSGQQVWEDFQEIQTDCGSKDYWFLVESIEEFLEGYYSGFNIEYEGQNSWVQCVKDGKQLVAHVQKLAEDADAGDIKAIMVDLENILADIQAIQADCFSSTPEPLITEIQVMLKDLKEEFEDNGWMQCVKDAKTLVSQVQKLAEDADAGDMRAIMEDLENILATIQAMQADCFSSKPDPMLKEFLVMLKDLKDDFVEEENGWMQCVKDAKTLVSQVQKLAEDADAGDMRAIMEDLENILATIQAMQADCFSSEPDVDDDFVIDIDVNGWKECVMDAKTLVDNVKQLVTDADAGDVRAIISDLQTIAATVQALQADCFSSDDESFIDIDFEEDADGWVECVKDAKTLVTQVQQLVEDADAGDFKAIMEDLTNILATIQAVQADCFSSEFEFIQDLDLDFSNQDWKYCIQDIKSIDIDVQALVKNVKAGQIMRAIEDVHAILADYQAIKHDCFSSEEEDEALSYLDEIVVEVQELVEEFQAEGEWKQCVADVQQLISEAQQLLRDIQDKDPLKIIRDLQAIAANIQAVEADCMASEGRVRLLAGEQRDWNKCVSETMEIGQMGMQLYKNVMDKDVSGIIKTVGQSFREIEEAKVACQVMDFFPKISFDENAAAECVEQGLDFGYEVFNELKENGFSSDQMFTYIPLAMQGKQIFDECVAAFTSFKIE